MALTTVSANLVWQQVKIALAQQSATAPQGIPQIVRNQFDALKAHLSQTKGNPNLFFATFEATTIDNASGEVSMGFPCTVYGVYGRKLATAVDVYLYLVDDASNEADVESSVSDARVVLPFIQTQDIVTAFFPAGLPMAAGLVVKAYTQGASSTSLNDAAAADAPNGFVIIGDPI